MFQQVFFVVFSSLLILVQSWDGYFTCVTSSERGANCDCKQSITGDPEYKADGTDPSKAYKSCVHDCCGEWMYDPNFPDRCISDLSGGYLTQSACEKAYGFTSAPKYRCDTTTLQCVVDDENGFMTEGVCNDQCGFSNTFVCVYDCGAYLWQQCLIIGHGDTNTQCWNEGTEYDSNYVAKVEVSRVLNERQLLADAAASPVCHKNGQICMDTNPNFPKCCDGFACIGQACKNSLNPDVILETVMCPSTNKPAVFKGKYQPAVGGFAECSNMDCSCTKGGPFEDCLQKKAPLQLSPPELNNLPVCYNAASSSSQLLLALEVPATSAKSSQSHEKITFRDHTFTHVSGIRSLEHPVKRHQRGSTGVKHFVEYEDPNNSKRKVRVEYEADLSEHHQVLSVDLELDIVALGCFGNGMMKILFKDLSSLDEFKNLLLEPVILTASSGWQCHFHDHEKATSSRVVAIRIVDKVTEIDLSSKSITVSTAPASYSHVLRNVKASFHTSVFPQVAVLSDDSVGNQKVQFDRIKSAAESHYNQQKSTSTAGRFPHSSLRKLGFFSWLGNAAKTVWHGVQTIANDVKKAVVVVINVVKDIFTGDFDLSKDATLATMNWNYNPDTKGAVNPNIPLGNNANCVNCFTHFELDVHAELHIKGYSFNSMMAYVEGDITHHMEVDVQNNGQTISGDPISVDKVLATIQLPFINFMIGPIPISINTTVPIHGGMTLHYAENGSIRAFTSASGNAKYGVQWTKDLGLQYIHQHSIGASGDYSVHGQASVGLSLYIMPVIVIVIDHIGGPNIGIKGSAEPMLKYDSSSSCTYGKVPAANLLLNFALQLTIGAQIDVAFLNHQIYEHEFDPAVIYSHKWPVLNKCMRNRAATLNKSVGSFEVEDDATNILVEGAVYRGMVLSKPGCETKLSNVSLQFLPNADDDYIFILSPFTNAPKTSSLSAFDIGCIGQQYYQLFNGVLQPFIPPAGEISVSQLSCDLDWQLKGYQYPVISGAALFSDDMSTITISVSDSCLVSPVVLVQEAKN